MNQLPCVAACEIAALLNENKHLSKKDALTLVRNRSSKRDLLAKNTKLDIKHQLTSKHHDIIIGKLKDAEPDLLDELIDNELSKSVETINLSDDIKKSVKRVVKGTLSEKSILERVNEELGINAKPDVKKTIKLDKFLLHGRLDGLDIDNGCIIEIKSRENYEYYCRREYMQISAYAYLFKDLDLQELIFVQSVNNKLYYYTYKISSLITYFNKLIPRINEVMNEV